MTDRTEALSRLVSYALAEQPADFKSLFDAEMANRCDDAVELRKAQLAVTAFAGADAPETPEEETPEGNGTDD
jgi:hypothetical protein